MTLDLETFATVRDFILQRGDRRTYCNMYNHNPHYDFGDFDAFLNPDLHQGNINCDPARSGFDELVLCVRTPTFVYVHVRVNGTAVEADANDETLHRYWSRMLDVIEVDSHR